MLVVVTDTGPLWSFAVVERLDLLGLRLDGRVAWTLAVATEIKRNISKEPLLASVLTQPWLPEPIDLDDLGLVEESLRIRRTLASPGEDPRMHLGEAEAITYAKAQQRACVLTEDASAVHRAKFEQLQVLRTTDILAEMVAMGETDAATAWDIYQRLAALGRLPTGLTPRDLLG